MRLELETRRFYLGRDYSEAVEAAGGIPVHIPLIADPEFVGRVIDGLDGVLLPGSDTDVDPGYYGEQPHPKLKKVIPEKDQTEMLVLEEAEKREMPVLAICYGMQALNVSRGGSLIQDIEAQVDDRIKHEQGVPLDRNSHEITIAEKGILADLAKTAAVKVNSHHHQAIRSIGSGLVATAWASDKIVECIEDGRAGRFCLGVQWHPELNWRSDELSHAIFARFVAECSSRYADMRKMSRAGSKGQ